jgi:hypothetical protein
VCWGTSPNPTISVNKSVAGTGGYGFTHSFGGLTGGTQYYVRAYARNSAGTYYSNERSFTYTTIGIGSIYSGGIVFYIDGTGQHGLVCAPSDQGSFQWGCFGTDISGTSTAFGTGMANTLAIVNGCSQRPIAASVCNDLVLNGYDDWYLPSRDELSLMYQNLRTQNIGNFSNNWYWSSSQSSPGSAWVVGFGRDGVYWSGSFGDGKHYNHPVRAVRAF